MHIEMNMAPIPLLADQTHGKTKKIHGINRWNGFPFYMGNWPFDSSGLGDSWWPRTFKLTMTLSNTLI